MMDLSLRLTRKYVGTWQHLDDWEHLGSIDEIGCRMLPREEDEDDLCEPQSREVFVLVTSEAEDEKIIRALHDTYTQWGCSHEHDCCGCRSYSAHDVKRVTGNLWRVEVHSSRNY